MNARTLLSLGILLLVLAATSVGVFDRTPGTPISYVTARGQPALAQGSGLYRYDPAAVAREGVVWDVINLVLGVPLLAVAIVLSSRGSLRGRLLLGGLLFYLFYVYLMYATMVAFNRLFLVYVAIFALSPIAFALNLREIDVARLPAQIGARFPRRLCIGFTLALSTALTTLWLGRIIPLMLTDRFPAEWIGVTTLETQALDLGLVVPLGLTTALLLWRRSAWGYLLASVTLTFGLLMCITIPAWIAVPLIEQGQINLIEASPLLLLSLLGLVIAGLFYHSVHATPPAGLGRISPAERLQHR